MLIRPTRYECFSVLNAVCASKSYFLLDGSIFLFSQDGLTALLAAASGEHTEVVQYLLENNANINSVDKVLKIIMIVFGFFFLPFFCFRYIFLKIYITYITMLIQLFFNDVRNVLIEWHVLPRYVM